MSATTAMQGEEETMIVADSPEEVVEVAVAAVVEAVLVTNRPFEVDHQLAAADEEERKKKPVIAEEDKEKPNFGLSGSLAAETNTTANGTILKYNEPPEARKPSQKWRLYVFKGDKEIDLLHIHRQSAFLFGRDRNVVDVPIEHPSCSKQHAVLQFRQIVETDALGQAKRTTKPFIIDLESANGTFVNGTKIPPTRYYELKLSDVLKFGASTREFVLLHESAES
ncbi:SMAD/FHA domain-containing protein [Linnemannia elongata AG-77]|uniref:SMAD/FHA domain-containing protein n=1 Tax=Linnemannia elongata AG-77 TaxID=1314771 RepID=A0A197JQC4_9FUNG|nr:SMAD/FHA domain-containing protein [Linnemannia elongata AG-77]